MKIRRLLSTVTIGAVLAAVGVVGTAQSASAAELASGQYVNPGSYVCGAQEIATGASLTLSGGILRQRALVFRNCGKTTLQRKADIIADFDGSCYSIGPGQARTLSALFVAGGRNTYRDAKSC